MMTVKKGFWIEMLTQTDVARINRASKETNPTIVLTNFPAGTHSEYRTSFISTNTMRKQPKISFSVHL
jgi:hypothetical protein